MATRVDYKRLERERKAALAAHGGDRALASLAHHKARMPRAVIVHDYATMRDAEKAIRDLEAIIRTR